MKSIYILIKTIAFITIFSYSTYSQIDSVDHNWISEVGISRRFASKPSNRLGTDKNGVQYNIEIGYEWKYRPKHKLGFLLSGQLIGNGFDAYLTPMISWKYTPNVHLKHRFSAGPILVKSYNDFDFINGFSLSYDIEISNKISITNRFDLLNNSKISPIFSYSPGIELKGKNATIIIVGGGAFTGFMALFFLQLDPQ